jgi:hypothetical protein
MGFLKRCRGKRVDGRPWLGIALGMALISCLHETDLDLKNSAPAFSAEAIEKDLFFPDSMVGVFAARDSNDDEVRIVPSTWPGHQSWSERGDSVALYLDGPDLGSFTGTLALADRRGAVDSVPFRIARTLRAFGASDGLIGWHSYRNPDPDRFMWFEESGIEKYGFELHYDPDLDGKAYSDGMSGEFALGGDFRLRVYQQIDSAPLQTIRMDFFLSTMSDTALRDMENVGLTLLNDSNGGASGTGHGFGETGGTRPVMPYTTYAAVIERTGAWYRILGADSAAADEGDWDTLLAMEVPVRRDEREFLHPHFRFSVTGGRNNVYAYFYGLNIERGKIHP